MPHVKGIDGKCIWICFQGELTQDDWDSYLNHMRIAFSGENGPIETVLGIAVGHTSPSAAQRKQIANLMEENSEIVAKIKGHALVSESKIARGAITAVNWIFRKPFKEAVFNKVGEALDWMDKISGEYDRAALELALHRNRVLK